MKTARVLLEKSVPKESYVVTSASGTGEHHEVHSTRARLARAFTNVYCSGAGSQKPTRRHLGFRRCRGEGARREEVVPVRRDAEGYPDFHARRPLRANSRCRRSAEDRFEQPSHGHARGVRGHHAPQHLGVRHYTVDEAKRTVTYHIVSASYPNLQGEAQTRTIDRLTADEFVNTNPNVAGGRGSASNFYKRAK